MTDDLFAIAEYQGWTKEGHQVYGIRGMGETYKKFWKSFNYTRLWENDDWPWSYVAFPKEEEVRFRSDWKDHIELYESDDVSDDPLPHVTVSKEEALLAEIFNNELQKEINKSVIEAINKAAKSNG